MSKIQCRRFGIGAAAWLLFAAGAMAVPEIDLCVPVNKTPSQFDLLVRTTEPTVSWVEVYADAAGATNLSGVVGMEVSPVYTGDPSLATNYYQRADRQAIQAAAAEKGLSLHRVSGCDSLTTYYCRVWATNETGVAYWPTNGLQEVTTELENDFVLESRQLVLEVNPATFLPTVDGAVGVLSAEGASSPISSFIGDGVSGSELYFDLSSLFSATSHVNMAMSGLMEFEVLLYGASDSSELSASFEISFSNATEVALASLGTMSVQTFILDIRSIAGQCSPAPGIYTNDMGSVISCSVTNSAVTDGLVQQVMTGWSLGSMAGTGAVVQVSVTNDLILTWNWKTRYWLDTGAGTYGEVDEPDQWVDADSVVTITATPDLFYHTHQWTGDTGGTTISADGNQVDVPMTQPRSILALFAENMDINGVPQRWFYENGFTNTWETAGAEDADQDGMLTWEEWVAGTSPTNMEEVLSLDIQKITESSNGMVLMWPGVSNRVYKVWRSTDLREGFRQISGNLQATPPINSFREPEAPAGQPAYYRISVERQ